MRLSGLVTSAPVTMSFRHSSIPKNSNCQLDSSDRIVPEKRQLEGNRQDGFCWTAGNGWVELAAGNCRKERRELIAALIGACIRILLVHASMEKLPQSF